MHQSISNSAPAENWTKEDEERMRLIFHNGNEGLHYKSLPCGKEECDAVQVDLVSEAVAE